MIEQKKQLQKTVEEENLVLPQFGCKCGLEYSTLSSLSNHIKMTHHNNAEEWKIKRGVPEGRRQRLNPAIKEKIKAFIKQNEKLRNYCEKISASECRGLFMQNIKYIEDLLEKFNLNKQQEIILQKEHIKFQELWNDIDISEIYNQTQQYLNAYCSVFFDVVFPQTKMEQDVEEEQKDEKFKSDQKYYYFYKSLLENNKSSDNKEMKQKFANADTSPKSNSNLTSPNSPSLSLNQQENAKISSLNSQQIKAAASYNSSASTSPSQSYLVNVHSSLNWEQDQYMRNFFNNYLLNRNNKQ